MKDHLGNVRLSFKPTSTTPNITQEDFYYPFDLRISRKILGEGIKYLYNGKEIEDKYDLYWYHYGARYYDPMIARWLSMDPADEFHSPYVYVGNDPVNLIDPDGRQVWVHPQILETHGTLLLHTDEFKMALLLCGEGGPLNGIASLSLRPASQNPKKNYGDIPFKGTTYLFINGKSVGDGTKYTIPVGSKYFHSTVFLDVLDKIYPLVTIPHEVGGHFGYNLLEMNDFFNKKDNNMFINIGQDDPIEYGAGLHPMDQIWRADKINEVFKLYQDQYKLNTNSITTEEDMMRLITPWPEGKE